MTGQVLRMALSSLPHHGPVWNCTHAGRIVKGIEILIEVRPEKRQEFLSSIDMLAEHESRTEGCVSLSVFEQYGMPNQFLWVECWRQMKQLRKRLDSDEFRALLGAIRVLGMLKKLTVVDAASIPPPGE